MNAIVEVSNVADDFSRGGGDDGADSLVASPVVVASPAPVSKLRQGSSRRKGLVVSPGSDGTPSPLTAGGPLVHPMLGRLRSEAGASPRHRDSTATRGRSDSTASTNTLSSAASPRLRGRPYAGSIIGGDLAGMHLRIVKPAESGGGASRTRSRIEEALKKGRRRSSVEREVTCARRRLHCRVRALVLRSHGARACVRVGVCGGQEVHGDGDEVGSHVPRHALADPAAQGSGGGSRDGEDRGCRSRSRRYPQREWDECGRGRVSDATRRAALLRRGTCDVARHRAAELPPIASGSIVRQSLKRLVCGAALSLRARARTWRHRPDAAQNASGGRGGGGASIRVSAAVQGPAPTSSFAPAAAAAAAAAAGHVEPMAAAVPLASSIVPMTTEELRALMLQTSLLAHSLDGSKHALGMKSSSSGTRSLATKALAFSAKHGASESPDLSKSLGPRRGKMGAIAKR